MIKRFVVIITLCAGTVSAETNWTVAIEWNQGELLKRAREPDLIALSTNAPSDLRVARFSYFPAFSDTIIIRVTLRGQHARVRHLIYRHPAIDDQNIPAEIVSMKTSPGKVSALLDRAEQFFKEGTHLKIKDEFGMDGETWLLEMMTDGEYHHVSVWIPTYDKKKRGTVDFVAICEKMTKLAQLSPRRDLENKANLDLCDPLNENDYNILEAGAGKRVCFLDILKHWFR